MEIISYNSEGTHRIIKNKQNYKLQKQTKSFLWKRWKTIDSNTKVKDCWLNLYDLSKNYAPIISRPS